MRDSEALRCVYCLQIISEDEVARGYYGLDADARVYDACSECCMNHNLCECEDNDAERM